MLNIYFFLDFPFFQYHPTVVAVHSYLISENAASNLYVSMPSPNSHVCHFLCTGIIHICLFPSWGSRNSQYQSFVVVNTAILTPESSLLYYLLGEGREWSANRVPHRLPCSNSIYNFFLSFFICSHTESQPQANNQAYQPETLFPLPQLGTAPARK